MARELSLIVDGFGGAGSSYPRAWVARWRTQRWLRGRVARARRRRGHPPAGSGLEVLAHRGDLSRTVAAVELGNLVRPTVAVAWLGSFAAWRLAQDDEWRHRLAGHQRGGGAAPGVRPRGTADLAVCSSARRACPAQHCRGRGPGPHGGSIGPRRLGHRHRCGTMGRLRLQPRPVLATLIRAPSRWCPRVAASRADTDAPGRTRPSGSWPRLPACSHVGSGACQRSRPYMTRIPTRPAGGPRLHWERSELPVSGAPLGVATEVKIEVRLWASRHCWRGDR